MYNAEVQRLHRVDFVLDCAGIPHYVALASHECYILAKHLQRGVPQAGVDGDARHAARPKPYT